MEDKQGKEELYRAGTSNQENQQHTFSAEESAWADNRARHFSGFLPQDFFRRK